MRAGGKVDCNAVVCVADGMCAEETCGSGSGGEAHRVRWPAAISPMRPLQSASFVASQRQTSCWCSERTGARTVKTRKRAFMSSVKSPWGECLAPGGFHQRVWSGLHCAQRDANHTHTLSLVSPENTLSRFFAMGVVLWCECRTLTGIAPRVMTVDKRAVLRSLSVLRQPGDRRARACSVESPCPAPRAADGRRTRVRPYDTISGRHDLANPA